MIMSHPNRQPGPGPRSRPCGGPETAFPAGQLSRSDPLKIGDPPANLLLEPTKLFRTGPQGRRPHHKVVATASHPGVARLQPLTMPCIGPTAGASTAARALPSRDVTGHGGFTMPTATARAAVRIDGGLY